MIIAASCLKLPAQCYSRHPYSLYALTVPVRAFLSNLHVATSFLCKCLEEYRTGTSAAIPAGSC